ncbi:EamA family transporter [Rhizobium sp. CRIBSB]|nr:EamA family transporter [Rhizobium sp. CRIBSB]
MPAVSSRVLALIVLILAACLLGLAPILVRLTQTGPAGAGFWRLAFALPLLVILTARPSNAEANTGWGRPSKWMVMAGLFFAADMSFWHYGLVMTSVANATVLCNLTPVVVTLFGWIMFKEAPGRLFMLALGLAMGGAVAMALGADGRQGTSPLLGDLLSLTVTIWYSAYFLTVKAARRTAGALQVTLWASVVGAPVMLAVALVLGETLVPANMAGWAACAGLGLVHVAGQGGVAWSLGRLPASVTAVTILIQPVVAGLLSYAIFKETMTAPQLIGGAVVLGAVLLAQWSARPRAGADTKTGATA